MVLRPAPPSWRRVQKSRRRLRLQELCVPRVPITWHCFLSIMAAVPVCSSSLFGLSILLLYFLDTLDTFFCMHPWQNLRGDDASTTGGAEDASGFGSPPGRLSMRQLKESRHPSRENLRPTRPQLADSMTSMVGQRCRYTVATSNLHAADAFPLCALCDCVMGIPEVYVKPARW